MNLAQKAHRQLTEAYTILQRTRQETIDDQERARIDAVIAPLHAILAALAGTPDNEADAVVEATLALERLVAGAKPARLPSCMDQLGPVMQKVGDLLHSGIGEKLEQTPEDPESPTPPAPASAAAASGPLPPGEDFSVPSPAGTLSAAAPLPLITPSTDFALLRSEYAAWFRAMQVRVERQGKVDWWVKQILAHQHRYEEVSARVNHMPWAMIGVIHAMECGLSFTGHLHNGDPLTQRTTRVPAGLPKKWNPPNSWEESALDALRLKNFHRVTDWSMPHMLYLLERFNGFGYRLKKMPTPYLWSFSDRYEKGKYLRDHVFDPEAVSEQCGAAVMLKTLADRGVPLG